MRIPRSADSPGPGWSPYAAAAARMSAVASMGCWSNWLRVIPRVHQPSLPIGVKIPRRVV